MKIAERKHPWLAATLSLFLPGLGQVYAGALVSGVAFMAASFALVYGAWHYLFFPSLTLTAFHVYAVLGIAVYLFALVHAWLFTRAVNKWNGFSRLRGRDPWLAAFLSYLIPGLGHLYAGRFVAAVVFFLLWWVLQSLILGLLIWLLPILPIYNVFLAVHAHRKTVGSWDRRQGMKLMIIFALAVLIAFSVLVVIYGGEIAQAYGSKE